MPTDDRRRRPWIAALSVAGLLLGPSRALAVRWESEFDPGSSASGPAGGTAEHRSPIVVVGWPLSHRLLAVTDGRRPGDPFAGPDVCGDAIHIPEDKGFELLPAVRAALDEDDQILDEMRKLAHTAVNGTLNTGDRLALDAAFQLDIARIDELAVTTTFYGIHVLDGSVDMCVDGVPVFVDLPDVTDGGLGLDGPHLELTTVTNAAAALVTVEQAIDAVYGHRAAVDREELALVDGPADGGLLEQQRVLERMQLVATEALDGTLSEAQRGALNLSYLQDVARVGAIAENVRFLGLPLLDGSVDVGLQGAPPDFRTLFFDLPDVTSATLGLGDTDLEGHTHALEALAAVDAALATVLEHHRRVVDAVRELQGS